MYLKYKNKQTIQQVKLPQKDVNFSNKPVYLS